MTERDPRPEGLTPAQSEAVRRLLAGARHDEGIPDDVATRLDAVIADLAAERADGPAVLDDAREAVVIPLRRRRWPQVLVAAAAVTVFGFGMAQIVGNGANDAGEDAGTADSPAEPEMANSLEPTDDQGLDGATPDFASPPDPQSGARDNFLLKLDRASLDRLGITELHQLRAGALDRDLEELTRTTTESAGAPFAYDGRAVAAECGPYYTVNGGESFAASYRRHLALVLFHPELDGVRLVEIYDCESDNPRQAVRTVTLQTGE